MVAQEAHETESCKCEPALPFGGLHTKRSADGPLAHKLHCHLQASFAGEGIFLGGLLVKDLAYPDRLSH